eukprot:Em0001g1814a
MSILKQLATEQINFNMNGYEDVIEVSEEEFTERVRGGGATPLTLPPRCHGDKLTCPAVAPQPGRSNNRNHLFDCTGQGCGYMPLDLTPAQARPSSRFKSKIWGHMSCHYRYRGRGAYRGAPAGLTHARARGTAQPNSDAGVFCYSSTHERPTRDCNSLSRQTFRSPGLPAIKAVKPGECGRDSEHHLVVGPQRPVKLLVWSGKLGNDGDMHGRTGPASSRPRSTPAQLLHDAQEGLADGRGSGDNVAVVKCPYSQRDDSYYLSGRVVGPQLGRSTVSVTTGGSVSGVAPPPRTLSVNSSSDTSITSS